MLYYNIFQILTQLLSTHLLKLNLWHLVKIKRKQDTKYTKKNRNNPNYVYWTNCCMYIFLYKLQQINATCNQYMFEKKKKKLPAIVDAYWKLWMSECHGTHLCFKFDTPNKGVTLDKHTPRFLQINLPPI